MLSRAQHVEIDAVHFAVQQGRLWLLGPAPTTPATAAMTATTDTTPSSVSECHRPLGCKQTLYQGNPGACVGEAVSKVGPTSPFSFSVVFWHLMALTHFLRHPLQPLHVWESCSHRLSPDQGVFFFIFSFCFSKFSHFLSFSDHLKWWFSFLFSFSDCVKLCFSFFHSLIMWNYHFCLCVILRLCEIMIVVFFILWSCEIVIFIFFNIRSCVILIVIHCHVFCSLPSCDCDLVIFIFEAFSFLFLSFFVSFHSFVLTIPGPLNCLQELPKGAFSQSLSFFWWSFRFCSFSVLCLENVP